MIRTKILFLALCAMSVLAAILGMAQVWADALEWDVFLKAMGTLVIVGTEISFLIAVDYDLPASRRKYLLMGLVALSAFATGLATLQIWAQLFAWALFVKMLASLFIIVLLIGFLLVAVEDFGSNKRLKDNNFLD